MQLLIVFVILNLILQQGDTFGMLLKIFLRRKNRIQVTSGYALWVVMGWIRVVIGDYWWLRVIASGYDWL